MQVTTEVKVQVDLLAILRPMVYAVQPPVLAVKEIRVAIGASADSTVYNKLNGQSPFTIEEFIAIARAYVARDEFTLINLMLDGRHTITTIDSVTQPDGKMSDNLEEVVEAAIAVTTKHKKGDKAGAIKAIPGVDLAVFGLKREAMA